MLVCMHIIINDHTLPLGLNDASIIIFTISELLIRDIINSVMIY